MNGQAPTMGSNSLHINLGTPSFNFHKFLVAWNPFSNHGIFDNLVYIEHLATCQLLYEQKKETTWNNLEQQRAVLDQARISGPF